MTADPQTNHAIDQSRGKDSNGMYRKVTGPQSGRGQAGPGQPRRLARAVAAHQS